MLTVSIPTYNTPRDLLDRAVRSVLASSQVDRLVIVNDGGATPDVPSDSRVELYTLPSNRGRYFCDAIVTQAVDGWWSPHDADDWSEPGRWDGYSQHPATLSSHVRHRAGQSTTRVAVDMDATPDFGDLGHWCAGVYHADRVRAAGGVLPQFRVGFDTLFLLMARLTGTLTTSPQTVYHYDRRAGSLTSDRQTGTRSRFRRSQAEQLRALYGAAWLAGRDGADPAVPLRRSVPADVRAQVTEHAARLKGVLC